VAAAALVALAGPYGSDVVRSATTWRDAPEYVRLFAPAAHQNAYSAAATETGIDAVLLELAADPSLVRTPGAWAARPQAPLDVFGRGGAYNRWALARLYGSRQPRVARGARLQDGRVVESWTLVSPYPAADLKRLEPGTLRIVLSLATMQ
jgi:hypothetical protein